MTYEPNVPGPYAILLFTHQTLLSSPDTCTTECHFCFGPASSFFLKLFCLSSPVAYWTSSYMGGWSFGAITFCILYCSWGFWGKNTEVVCHSLVQWTTFCQTLQHNPLILGPLHGMVHSFLKLHKAVIHLISLVSFLWLWFSFWRLWDYGSCFLMGETGCGKNWFLLCGCEEIPLVQGKEQWLRFAGAAVKRYPMSKVREPQVRW